MDTNQKNVVIPVVLKGTNYLLWSRTTKTALRSRGLWGYVDPQVESIDKGSAVKEGSGVAASGAAGVAASVAAGVAAFKEESKTEQEDQFVLAALQSSLEPAILAAYSYAETARELWKTLLGVYGNMSNVSRIFEVKKALNEIQQGDRSFKDLFGEYRGLWAELELLRPQTTDAKEISERRDQDLVFGLLLSLNGSFKDFIHHILRFDKLPSFTEVCMQIQREEGSRGLFRQPSEVAHVVKEVAQFGGQVGRKGYPQMDKRKFECEHCKMKGHTKEKCWTLYPHLKPKRIREGGPPWEDTRSFEGSALWRGNRLDGSDRAGPSSSSKPSSYMGSVSVVAGEDMGKKYDLEELIRSLSEFTKSGKSLSDWSKSLFAGKTYGGLIVDSGASHHMIKDIGILRNVKEHLGSVVIADGRTVPIEGIGDLELFNKKTKALYMPSFASNLLSVQKTTKDLDCLAVFGSDFVEFQDSKSRQVIGEGKVEEGAYVLKEGNGAAKFLSTHEGGERKFLAVNAVGESPVWHARLGHPSSKVLQLVLPNLIQKDEVCESCILGKHSRQPFDDSSTVYDEVFALVHSDVWTAPCFSKDQYKYFVSFIDEKSKYTWVTLLSTKSQVYESFLKFHSYVATQFGAKIKILRSDNGGEYISGQFKELLSKHGIVHQTTCPYTPQQNGVSERKNRHIMEVARTIMFERGVPKRFWGDAVMTAVYLINRLPTNNLKGKSPYEVLHKKKPSIDHLRVFGCKCFVFLHEGQRSKLEARSVKCVFVGYSQTQKGYRCYDPEARREYVSRDVKFEEQSGYFDEKYQNGLKEVGFPGMDRAPDLEVPIVRVDYQRSESESSTSDTPTHDSTFTPSHHTEPSQEFSSGGENEPSVSEPVHSTDEESIDEETHVEVSSPIQLPLRRSQRQRYSPSHWKQNRVYFNNIAADHQGQTDSRLEKIPIVAMKCSERTEWVNPTLTGDSDDLSQMENHVSTHANDITVSYPIEAFCTMANLPQRNRVYLGKIGKERIPVSYEEACSSKVWVEAMREEMKSMKENNTWDMMRLPKGKKPVGCRWVFTIKYKSSGEIERYKARLVAKGYTQVYGEDYTETFAPVAKLHSVRVLLSIAVNLSWDLWQMDVKNAFLQGELEEEVYMAPPPGYGHEAGNVCRLRKAIYGLKQSPRAWYHKLSSCLSEKGFKISEADHTLFTRKGSTGIVVVLIYVDDLIITGDDVEGMSLLKKNLKESFDIKDLGELKYFLGIEMTRFEDGLFISQRKYVLDLLIETGKLGSRPAKTPIEEGYQDYGEGELFEDVKQYQRLVGKLIYLTITRPDLCFAVNQVSQHMSQPTVHHWNMVERILRYLKGNPGKGVWMEKSNDTSIIGYCDADWAGNKKDRKSTTGFCTFVGGNLVTWRSKKQKVVSLSSAEAEYRAMRDVTKELVWIKYLLERKTGRRSIREEDRKKKGEAEAREEKPRTEAPQEDQDLD